MHAPEFLSGIALKRRDAALGADHENNFRIHGVERKWSDSEQECWLALRQRVRLFHELVAGPLGVALYRFRRGHGSRRRFLRRFARGLLLDEVGVGREIIEALSFEIRQ